LAATFARRGTPLPAELPDALTADFANDPAKRQQWAAFLEDVGASTTDLTIVIENLGMFLMPHTARAAARQP
jgi:hypothetical protein